MAIELRDYQREAIDSLYKYFSEKDGNPLIIAPTAAGKSIIIAKFCEEVLTQWSNQRIFVLSHVRELIKNDYDKFMQVYPDADAGVYSASLKRRDIYHKILFMGIQSVHKKAMQVGVCDLILVDEAHLINHKDAGMYRNFINDMKDMNPKVNVIGFTATAFRTTSGDITKGEDALFTDIAYEISMKLLLERGYLSPLVSKRMAHEADTSKLHIRAGEFVKEENEALFDNEELTQAALDEVERFASDRKCWLFFCASIKHSENVRDALRARGYSAEAIHSKMGSDDRNRVIDDCGKGKIRAITNVDVVTTGTDIPRIDMIVYLRGTASPIFYVQSAGRGMRLSPQTGKKDCLVLDFAGNVMRHGPVDAIRPWVPTKKKKRADNPMKSCPQKDCLTIVPVQTKYCPVCGHEFEMNHKDPHGREAYDGAILSSQMNQPIIREYEVDEVRYAIHNKIGKPSSMRVEYYCGFTCVAKEWVFLETPGLPHRKAIGWWADRGALPAPDNVTAGVLRAKKGELREPSKIAVNEGQKYPQIINFEFGDNHEQDADERTATGFPGSRGANGSFF